MTKLIFFKVAKVSFGKIKSFTKVYGSSLWFRLHPRCVYLYLASVANNTHPLNTMGNQGKQRKLRALNLNLLIRIFLGKKRRKIKQNIFSRNNLLI